MSKFIHSAKACDIRLVYSINNDKIEHLFQYYCLKKFKLVLPKSKIHLLAWGITYITKKYT